ncbi:hypothetical protein GCM10023222_15570 [Saccharopolyspora cebuensis]
MTGRKPGRPCSARSRRPIGYLTAMRGDLADVLADVTTKRRHAHPPGRWAEPSTALLTRVLDGLDRL